MNKICLSIIKGEIACFYPQLGNSNSGGKAMKAEACSKWSHQDPGPGFQPENGTIDIGEFPCIS